MVIGLVKALENVRLVLDRNAVAGIFNRDHEEAFVVWASANGDGSARRRIFDGIGDQVVENLLHTLGIDIQYGRMRRYILVEDYRGFDGLRLQTGENLPG